MVDEKEIIEKIKKTRLFNTKLKQEIIGYFKFLNNKQKTNLVQVLKIEENIIKKYLSSLKEKETIKFEEIKENIEKLQKQDRYLNELKEKTKDDKNINNLLNELESL